MTAEGLLCRQYLGWRRKHSSLVGGAKYLLEEPINARQKNVYYWYYATQVLHHMEGDLWKQWNKHLSTKLPDMQVKEGAERGSWSPHGDEWGGQGGRLYTTCLSIYMLEVYYRHLPIYSHHATLRAQNRKDRQRQRDAEQNEAEASTDSEDADSENAVELDGEPSENVDPEGDTGELREEKIDAATLDTADA